MATSVTSLSSRLSSRQKVNYIRLCRLSTDTGTAVMREVFDSFQPPASLQKDLNSTSVYLQLKSLKDKRVLKDEQWEMLYPASGVPSSANFDITLLFLLLRHICGLIPPATGWSADPLPTDDSKEADLIRIKLYRNKIAHQLSAKAELSDADFESHWIEIEAALIRLGGTKYKKDIQSLKDEPLDPENEADKKKIDVIIEKLDKINMELSSKGESYLQLRINEQRGPFCILPQKPSHETIFRTTEVSTIMAKIQQLKAKYPDEITLTYLSGNPGCGKSELARQIGKEYFDEIAEPAKCVITLNGSNLETLTQSYKDLAYHLRCSEILMSSIMNTTNSQEQKLTDLKGLVVAKLYNYSFWFMVVDNVEDLQLISKYIPHAGQKQGRGHILITTQDSQSIQLSDTHAHHLPLSRGMEPRDAVQSLLAISECIEDEKTIHSVAKELDFQPLALACAAVYMKRVRIADPATNWTTYLQEIKRGNRESTERLYEKISKAYGKSMTNAVKMAVKNSIEKNQVMHHAFEFLAAMAPEFISIHYVVNYVMKCMSNEDEKFVGAEIMTSSLVLSTNEKDEPMVRVHQVVLSVLQAVIHELHIIEGTDELSHFTKVMEVFSHLDAMDKDSIDYITSTARLVPHFIALAYKVKGFFERHEVLIPTKNNKYGVRYRLNTTTPSQYFPIITLMKERLYTVLKTHYKFDISRFLLEMCITLVTHTDIHAGIGYMYNELGGNLLVNKNEDHEAKECFEKALSTYENTHGNNHPSVAGVLNNIGLTLLNLSKYEEARQYLVKALEINERNYASNDAANALNLSNLAEVSRHLGIYEEAENLYEKALTINISTYGNNHPKVAKNFTNLGLVLRDEGRYEEAKDYFEKAFAIDNSNYGNNHPQVAANFTNLGAVLSDQGKYEEAKDYFEKAITIDKSNYGNNHPKVAANLTNLGLILRDQRRYEEAKDYLEKSITINKSNYGNNHPKVASNFTNLGVVLSDQGRYEEAKDYFEKAFTINNSTYGNNHPQVAANFTNLGLVLRDQGRYEEAKDYLEKAITIDKSNYGNNHPKVAANLTNLGLVLRDQGRYEEAKDYLDKAITINKSNQSNKSKQSPTSG